MPVPAIVEARFSATVVEEGGDIAVRLTGNADVSAKHHIEALLGSVHTEALRLRAASVRLDVRELVFMSSSCFKNFICWLEKVRELGESERYRVFFLSSAAQHWQRRSLHAVTYFAREIVTIEVGD
jgi:hypothetical protein